MEEKRVTEDQDTEDVRQKELQKMINSQTAIKEGILRIFLLGTIGTGCVVSMYYLHIGWTALIGACVFFLVSWFSDSNNCKDRLSASRRGILVTGCDTGFGFLLAKHLDSIGATVFAGVLDKDGEGAIQLRKEGSSRMHVLQMDVTNDNQIQECVEYVQEVTGRPELWGLVNNAGLNFLGDIELTTMEQFERVANINQLGMVRVTKAFLPMIRKKKGRIVNVSSVKGRFAEPYNASYGMTKFAVECFSDVLRLEMKKFAVNVSIVEPGNFGGATGCLNMERIEKDFESMWNKAPGDLKRTFGKEYLDDHIKRIHKAIPTASFNLKPVIDAITDGVLGLKPKPRYIVPGSSGLYDIYRWRIILYPYIPTWLMDTWLLSDHKTKLPPACAK